MRIWNHGIRVIHFYVGDDDDEPWKGGENLFDSFEEVENDKPKVGRLGEERGDVAIIIDSGADVALFSLTMADHGEGEPEFNAATKLQDAQGNRLFSGGAKSVEISLREVDGHEVLH